MSSASVIATLKYRDVHTTVPALPIETSEERSVEPISAFNGVSEDEVKRRVQMALETFAAETEERFRSQLSETRRECTERIVKALRSFDEQRSEYFRSVEREVVQLALAIARKILARETMVDPTLLSALVRIAIDRMQCGSSVKVRIRPEEIKHWEVLGEETHSGPKFEVIGDSELRQGDCIVETDLGTANFGIEAQLKDVEETFLQLIAHRPAA